MEFSTTAGPQAPFPPWNRRRVAIVSRSRWLKSSSPNASSARPSSGLAFSTSAGPAASPGRAVPTPRTCPSYSQPNQVPLGVSVDVDSGTKLTWVCIPVAGGDDVPKVDRPNRLRLSAEPAAGNPKCGRPPFQGLASRTPSKTSSQLLPDLRQQRQRRLVARFLTGGGAAVSTRRAAG